MYDFKIQCQLGKRCRKWKCDTRRKDIDNQNKIKNTKLSAVILKNYKKTGRDWTRKPLLVTQDQFNQADKVLEIKLKQKSRGEIKNIKPEKYLLKTWIADPITFVSTIYNDEFEII